MGIRDGITPGLLRTILRSIEESKTSAAGLELKINKKYEDKCYDSAVAWHKTRVL